MAEERVKSGLWVRAALRLGNAAGRFGVVVRHGDDDSGGVLVLLRGREGSCVLSQIRAADGSSAWLRATGPSAIEAEAAEAYIERQIRVDPDLWVIEFDSPDLLPPFEARIVT